MYLSSFFHHKDVSSETGCHHWVTMGHASRVKDNDEKEEKGHVTSWPRQRHCWPIPCISVLTSDSTSTSESDHDASHILTSDEAYRWYLRVRSNVGRLHGDDSQDAKSNICGGQPTAVPKRKSVGSVDKRDFSASEVLRYRSVWVMGHGPWALHKHFSSLASVGGKMIPASPKQVRL